MDHKIPSEDYLLSQRKITGWDEAMLYGACLALLFSQNYWALIPVLLFGGPAVWISYKRLWAMEEKRFGLIWRFWSKSNQENHP